MATLVLALAARGRTEAALALVYGLSVTFLFTASALYHATKRGEDGQTIWRRLDHLAIFFMIAGSYTPVCWVHLQGAWRWSILGTQWGLVALGLLFKLWFMAAPRWVTAAIYVAMGWIAVIPMHKLLASWSPAETGLLLGGGGVYTLGAMIYALKRPDPWPGRFGFHEIFHVAVICAAVLHYAAIYPMLT